MKLLSYCLISLLCFLTGLCGTLYGNNAKTQIEQLNQKIQQASDQGDLQAAIEAAEQAFEIASNEFGSESLETAKAMNNMANLYLYAGHAAEAESFYKKAIVIETVHYDHHDLALADSFYNLAMAYAIQQKFDAASKMLDKAYKIRVEKLGADHPDSKKIREALDEVWKEN